MCWADPASPGREIAVQRPAALGLRTKPDCCLAPLLSAMWQSIDSSALSESWQVESTTKSRDSNSLSAAHTFFLTRRCSERYASLARSLKSAPAPDTGHASSELSAPTLWRSTRHLPTATCPIGITRTHPPGRRLSRETTQSSHRMPTERCFSAGRHCIQHSATVSTSTLGTQSRASAMAVTKLPVCAT
jgi:hypothetical protein